MSEYRGGLLGSLARIFMKAVAKIENPSERKKLVAEWNEEIKRINKLL